MFWESVLTYIVHINFIKTNNEFSLLETLWNENKCVYQTSVNFLGGFNIDQIHRGI